MIVFGVFLYNKKSVLYALVVHVEYCVLFYLFYSSCLLRQPRKGNIQEDAPSFLNVVLLGPLPPSTVSWDKQALPATQSKERVKKSEQR